MLDRCGHWRLKELRAAAIGTATASSSLPRASAARYSASPPAAARLPQSRNSSGHSDGERFLMSPIVEEAATSPITVILNWKGETQ